MESKNPNETILIPLLNKRLTDLVVTTILTEAKLLYCEEEKTELKTLLEKEQTAAKQLAEDNASAFSKALQEQTQSIRDTCEQEKTAVQQAAEHSKQEIAKNWAQELASQTGNLNARINALTVELESSNQLVSSLRKEIEELTVPVVVVEEKTPPQAKRNSKKLAGAMSNDTY
jgi:chromosome segregation ATPase